MNEFSLLRVYRVAAALTAIGAAAAFLLLTVGVGAGILLGGVLAVANLRWLASSLSEESLRVPGAGAPDGVSRGAARAGAGAILRTLVRLGVTAGALAGGLATGAVAATGLAAGFCVVPAAIVFEALRVSAAGTGGIATAAGAPVPRAAGRG